MKNRKRHFLSERLNSFRFALSGIFQVFKNEPNAKIHLLCATVCLVLCSILPLSAIEWVILLSCIGLVLAAELINSSIESLSDLVCKTHHPLIKLAKDYAAGAVLILAIFSLIIGLIILIPHISNFFF